MHAFCLGLWTLGDRSWTQVQEHHIPESNADSLGEGPTLLPVTHNFEASKAVCGNLLLEITLSDNGMWA